MRALAIIGWFLLFGLAGIGAASVLALLPALPAQAHLPPAVFALHAAAFTTPGFLLLYAASLGRGILAGTRSKNPPARFGARHGFYIVIGFALAQIAGAGLVFGTVAAVGLLAGHRESLSQAIDRNQVALAAGIAGYLASAIFSLIYARRHAAERITDGAPTGLAWCRPEKGGYRAAIFCAVLVVAAAFLLYRIFPPDLRSLDQLESTHMFSSFWGTVALVVMATVIAPPLEEYVFRGFAFAAFATRFGNAGAALLTTVLFIAAHAPDKIHYKPGFIDVGLMALLAAWLRLRYRSIRPGILLHLLYNAGLTLAVGLGT